ncbi:hypothetical protein ACPCSG_23680 [Streptomyces cellulosae]
MIETRVCIDDTLGPFDCQLDPANRWNGFLSPLFTLATARKLSAQTLALADECGYDSTETVHVIDGRADSPDTVHVIEGGPSRHSEDGENLAVAVHVPWRSLDGGATATITDATPAARKAAERKPAGRGAARAVIVHVRWQYLDEGSTTAAEVIEPSSDGLYCIGGWEWCWGFASWWCPRSNCFVHWHEDCQCGLTRPATPLGVAAWTAGRILHDRAREATSALVDLTHSATICQVFAGDTEIDTADDTGPFDTETLGQADTVLRAALDDGTPADLAAAGWEHVPDPDSDRVYRITFPASRTH